MYTGSNVNILCNSVSVPQWYKGDKLLRRSNRIRLWRSLRISNASSDDSGIYTCKGQKSENDDSFFSAKSKLLVGGKNIINYNCVTVKGMSDMFI